MNVIGAHWWRVSIGSGNGLVPSGNKPLPETMLTKFYEAMWCHKTTMKSMFKVCGLTLTTSVYCIEIWELIILNLHNKSRKRLSTLDKSFIANFLNISCITSNQMILQYDLLALSTGWKGHDKWNITMCKMIRGSAVHPCSVMRYNVIK